MFFLHCKDIHNIPNNWCFEVESMHNFLLNVQFLCQNIMVLIYMFMIFSLLNSILQNC